MSDFDLIIKLTLRLPDVAAARSFAKATMVAISDQSLEEGIDTHTSLPTVSEGIDLVLADEAPVAFAFITGVLYNGISDKPGQIMSLKASLE